MEDNYSIGPTVSKVNCIERQNLNVVLIIRDPRDLVMAMGRCQQQTINSTLIRDIISNPGKYLSKATGNNSFFLKYNSYLQIYLEYLEWGEYPFVYITRFEDLVGPRGGGSEKRQIREVLNIAEHIGKPLTYEEAQSVARELFGNTPTFKKGQFQDWKKHFTNQDLMAFNVLNEGLLEVLDYEK